MRMPPDEYDDAKFAMAPMIDMVFLLLVFFMCASHVSSQTHLSLNMPQASAGVVPRDRADRWIINVLEDGTLHSGPETVDLDTLRTLISDAARRKPDLRVYLRADANVPHREIAPVMAVMAEAGIDDFIFGVYTPSPTVEEAP